MATNAAALLNVPQDDQGWDIWAFSLSMNVREINEAILSQLNQTLPDPQLYPIPQTDPQLWLERLSTALGNICGVLKLQAADTENVDLSNIEERRAWSNVVFQEVRDARAALKI